MHVYNVFRLLPAYPHLIPSHNDPLHLAQMATLGSVFLTRAICVTSATVAQKTRLLCLRPRATLVCGINNYLEWNSTGL